LSAIVYEDKPQGNQFMVGYIISKTPENPKKILNRAKVLDTFVSRVKLVEKKV